MSAVPQTLVLVSKIHYITDMTSREVISGRILALPLGEPFSTVAFLDVGTRAAVDQSLSRLTKAGVIERLGRGIYVRPKQSRFVGKVTPSPFKVALAVTRGTGAIVDVHGAEAARRLGLTTQVPAQPTYYTTGPSRHFKLGDTEVRLKHVAPRKLVLAGRPAGLALSALWYLGQENVTAEVIAKVAQVLEPEELAALRAVRPSMPGWMADAFVANERGVLKDG